MENQIIEEAYMDGELDQALMKDPYEARTESSLSLLKKNKADHEKRLS